MGIRSWRAITAAPSLVFAPDRDNELPPASDAMRYSFLTLASAWRRCVTSAAGCVFSVRFHCRTSCLLLPALEANANRLSIRFVSSCTIHKKCASCPVHDWRNAPPEQPGRNNRYPYSGSTGCPGRKNGSTSGLSSATCSL